jgi:hypothetical protein
MENARSGIRRFSSGIYFKTVKIICKRKSLLIVEILYVDTALSVCCSKNARFPQCFKLSARKQAENKYWRGVGGTRLFRGIKGE